jgi:hypothetical protein
MLHCFEFFCVNCENVPVHTSLIGEQFVPMNLCGLSYNRESTATPHKSALKYANLGLTQFTAVPLVDCPDSIAFEKAVKSLLEGRSTVIISVKYHV